MEHNTPYGTIKEITNYSYYKDSQQLQDICCDTENKLTTSVGTLIPRFSNPDDRRKSTRCLSFYRNGVIKSIDLQEQTLIPTSVGNIPAELVTFYENGSLHRVFPRNGQLSGFWTEEDEASINPVIFLSLAHGTIEHKLNSLTFYPDGNLKSLCLSLGEKLSFPVYGRTFPIRFGISFYENGMIAGVEPAEELSFHTPLGELHAYHAAAMGIHADDCSLRFSRQGELQSLVTSKDCISFTTTTGKSASLKPFYRINPLTNESLELVPLKITFDADKVLFHHPAIWQETPIIFSRSEITNITITELPKAEGCGLGCAQCQKCG